MTSYTIMQFVDKWLVSKIGSDPIYVGAQGNGGLASWVPISIVMGFLGIVNTYVAQNLGAGKPERGAAYVWNAIWLSVIAGCLMIPYGLLMPEMFREMGHDERRVLLECQYGQPLVFGAMITMVSRCVAQYFYGMHRPSIVLVAGVTANVVNIGVSYALIWGKFGLPALGIQGSAIGTVIATGVELAIPAFYFLVPMHRLHRTREHWRPRLSHIKDLLRLGWPGAATFGSEMVCWAIFMVYLVGIFGERHSTAGWIAHQYMSLSFMPAVGISVAMTALVGKCMGQARPDLAHQRTRLGLAVTTTYMTLCGIIFIAFRESLVRLFISDEMSAEDASFITSLGGKFLIAAAAFQFFDGVAMTLSGSLRGAGDTQRPGIITVVLSWLLIVGGGFAFVNFLPSLQSLGPWIAAASYIIALSVFLSLRYASGRWKTMSVVERPAAAH
jgi:MATE family multidrug resistance protein